jgi:hypothetical protein
MEGQKNSQKKYQNWRFSAEEKKNWENPGKIQESWEGPYIEKETNMPGAFRLTDQTGEELRIHGIQTT